MPTSPQNQPAVRVFIADDQPAIRAGMSTLLELEDGVEVVGQACNGFEALEFLKAHLTAVDVVLMDIKMPVMSGIEASRELGVLNGPPVVLFTTFEDVDDMLAGLNAGVSGYLFKDSDGSVVASALKRVVQGESVIDPRVSRLVAQRHAESQKSAYQAAGLESIQLTPKETEVLHLLRGGATNKQIARLMGLTEGTVKVHMNRILSKMGVRTRTEAILLALKLGIAEKIV